MTFFSFLFRSIRKLFRIYKNNISHFFAKAILTGNDVKYNRSLICNGIPKVDVHRTANFYIGQNCCINSSITANPIGRYTPTMLMVRENAVLRIGDHVGLSSTAIICQKEIIIDDNVKIGGGVCIYDTDFHSLKSDERKNLNLDSKNKNTASVHIKKNVFIGAHSTILKGVTIGENSIIGACSVVTKNIPENEIWAGNPARFIKAIK